MPSGSSADTNEIKIFAIGGIVALIVVMFLVTQATRPPQVAAAPQEAAAERSGRIDYMQHGPEANARVDELAKQSGGDFTKLSLEDQQMLDAMTAGHGMAMLEGRAAALKAKAAKKKTTKTKQADSTATVH